MTGASHPHAALLRTFVATRRGLRFGSLFGEPAVFAGGRVAIRLDGPLLALRLTPASRDLARSLFRSRVRGVSRGWLRLDPPRDLDAVPAAYLTLFERAVRDTALGSDLRGAGTAA